MTCKPIQRQLSDYVDGCLPDDVSHEIEQHLNVCRICRREWEALKRTVRLIQLYDSSESVPVQELDALQSQVLQALDEQAATSGWRRMVAQIKLRFRAWQATGGDLFDRHQWGMRLQVGLMVIALVFAGIWIDRRYFRPEMPNMPDMLRAALIRHTTDMPPSLVDPELRVTPRGFRYLDQRTTAYEASGSRGRLVDEARKPTPLELLNEMDVRAVEVKDGKLLFVGAVDLGAVGLIETKVEEGPFQDVPVPTTSAAVVMLPRNFDGPEAPSRMAGGDISADLSGRLFYPVAVPPTLVIDEETGQQQKQDR